MVEDGHRHASTVGAFEERLLAAESRQPGGGSGRGRGSVAAWRLTVTRTTAPRWVSHRACPGVRGEHRNGHHAARPATTTNPPSPWPGVAPSGRDMVSGFAPQRLHEAQVLELCLFEEPACFGGPDEAGFPGQKRPQARPFFFDLLLFRCETMRAQPVPSVSGRAASRAWPWERRRGAGRR